MSIYTWDFTTESQQLFVYYSASSVIQSMLDARVQPLIKKQPSKVALQFKAKALNALGEELVTCGNTISDQLLLAVLVCSLRKLHEKQKGDEFLGDRVP